jgi:hypothetical protein
MLLKLRPDVFGRVEQLRTNPHVRQLLHSPSQASPPLTPHKLDILGLRTQDYETLASMAGGAVKASEIAAAVSAAGSRYLAQKVIAYQNTKIMRTSHTSKETAAMIRGTCTEAEAKAALAVRAALDLTVEAKKLAAQNREHNRSASSSQASDNQADKVLSRSEVVRLLIDLGIETIARTESTAQEDAGRPSQKLPDASARKAPEAKRAARRAQTH